MEAKPPLSVIGKESCGILKRFSSIIWRIWLHSSIAFCLSLRRKTVCNELSAVNPADLVILHLVQFHDGGDLDQNGVDDALREVVGELGVVVDLEDTDIGLHLLGTGRAALKPDLDPFIIGQLCHLVLFVARRGGFTALLAQFQGDTVDFGRFILDRRAGRSLLWLQCMDIGEDRPGSTAAGDHDDEAPEEDERNAGRYEQTVVVKDTVLQFCQRIKDGDVVIDCIKHFGMFGR